MKQLSLSLALTLLLPLGCSKNTTIPERTETTISASGGTARSAAGELSLAIPAGVLPAGTIVTITTERDRVPTGVVGPVFELSSEPKVTRFDPPIVIEIANPRAGSTVAIANLDGAEPVIVGAATYDAAAGRARGALEHFSRYGLVTTTATVGCPGTRPDGLTSCSSEGQMCAYGQECCCGQCHPEWQCRCSGGQWACGYTDACLGAGITCPDGGVVVDSGADDAGQAGCPAEGDVLGASCSNVGLVCEYGVEACCGQEYPAMHCECDGSSFVCRPTDACLVPCFPLDYSEVEPNDTTATANVIPTAQQVRISAAMGQGDVDNFRVTVTATVGGLRARTHADRDDLSSCVAPGTSLLLRDLGGRFLASATQTSTHCAALSMPATAGQYYLTVSTSTPAQPGAGAYYLTVDLPQ